MGKDIFTGKKVEGLESSTHNMLVPHVTKTEFSLIAIDDEGYCTLMDNDGV